MSKASSVRQSAEPVVRAIDVGFGLVKFSLPGPDGKVAYANFPSLAIPSSDRLAHLPGATARDTVDVPVKGQLYEVGPDVVFAQAGNEYGRAISDEFYRSDIYMALAKGALRYMAQAGDSVIDVLVLGLPNNQFINIERCNYLLKEYSGEIDLGDGIKVNVKNVTVQAQPMGAFMDLAPRVDEVNAAMRLIDPEHVPISSLKQLNLLIVDPGEFTLDWMLFRHGRLDVKVTNASSDAGRDRVVRAVKKALEAKISAPLSAADTMRINECMRNGEVFRFQGRSYSLNEFDDVAMSQVLDSMGPLLSGINAASNFIDLFVYVGGHPELYKRVLSERYPNIAHFVVDNSVEANVRGFSMIGRGIARG